MRITFWRTILTLSLFLAVGCQPSQLDLKMQEDARKAQEKTRALLDRQKALERDFPRWPVHVRMMISQGKIMTGMSRQQVRLAMDKPHEVSRRLVNGVRHEQWIYRYWRPDPEGPVNYMSVRLNFQADILVLIEEL